MGVTRRKFVRAALGTGLAFSGGCRSVCFWRRENAPAAKPVPRQLNIALIGAGGRGGVNGQAVCASGERIVALCDVDETALQAGHDRVAPANPGVRLYKDFRVMLESEPALDAVFISTPDHGHAVQASWAMERGCHVYVETPLTRTLGELRFLRGRAAAHHVILRAGDSDCAAPEFRRAVQLLQAGVIGDVMAVYAWTGRPVWPQGKVRPAGCDPIPATLDWNLWLGSAPVRPYKDKTYHRYNWRGWQDFGTGALGDCGCQLLGLPFRALNWGMPVSAEAVDTAGRSGDMYPKASHVQFTFKAPDRHRAAPTLDWFDGNWKPDVSRMPQVAAAFKWLPTSGCLLVGDRGVWLVGDDTGTRHYLALSGEERVIDFEKHAVCSRVAALSKGPGLQREFLAAVHAGDLRFSDLDAVLPMTACLLTGCAAQCLPGRLTWNSRKWRFDGNETANQRVAPLPREGWACRS